MRNLRLFIFIAFGLVLPASALAQVIEPKPHPRIDRAGQQNPIGDNSAMFEPVLPNETTSSPTTLTIPDTNPATPLPAIGPEQPVSVSAQIKEGGPIIPNGLVWRVFGKTTDETGKLPLLYRSEDATASFSLSPGEYVVHVSYGRAQSSDTLTVALGPNVKSIVLEAGALRLRSAVTTEINIPPNQLKFDIFTEGLDGESIPVALNIEQNTMVQLNAGTYKVVSKWGDQNAVVRADIRVEPGEVTEATLFHKASQVMFSLVSKAGGEAIADVDWKVQDSEGETIYTHFGAFPSTVLAEGDYTVFAQTGDTVYNRQFQAQAGRPINIEVLTTVY